jgi:hypothetical protein
MTKKLASLQLFAKVAFGGARSGVFLQQKKIVLKPVPKNPQGLHF